MILKVMRFKKGNHSDGKTGEAIHEHESTDLIEGITISWSDMKAMDGEQFTRFIVDENLPTERSRMIAFEAINAKLYSVYVLNNNGKTIQRPI